MKLYYSSVNRHLRLASVPPQRDLHVSSFVVQYKGLEPKRFICKHDNNATLYMRSHYPSAEPSAYL